MTQREQVQQRRRANGRRLEETRGLVSVVSHRSDVIDHVIGTGELGVILEGRRNILIPTCLVELWLRGDGRPWDMEVSGRL